MVVERMHLKMLISLLEKNVKSEAHVRKKHGVVQTQPPDTFSFSRPYLDSDTHQVDCRNRSKIPRGNYAHGKAKRAVVSQLLLLGGETT